MTDETPKASYERRRDIARTEDARFDGRSAIAGNGRVVVLLAAMGLAGRAWSGGHEHPWKLYGALLVLFVATLVAQDQIDRRRDQARLRVLLYNRSIDRLAGLWRKFTARGTKFEDPAHPFAKDLDVLGESSLFQLLDTTRTVRGEATLASWLMSSSSLAQLTERRDALRALQADPDARERVSTAGLDKEISRIDEDPLLIWAEGPELFDPPAAIVWAARIAPFVTIATYLAYRSELVPFWPVFVLLLGHAALLQRTREGIHRVGELAEKTEAMLSRLLPLFEASRTMPTSTPMLAALVERLAGAVEATQSLRRRVTVFQSRLNLIVAVLLPILLWDIHAALLLQSWQRTHRTKVRSWFEALGALEALAAMATYAYEHSADTWPELVDGPPHFEAVELGHPLLDASACVRNDVTLQGAGTALLVTGSNMSGKSTLLRAVGLNSVLALAGLPVRAKRMRLSLVQVATSMRVSDSLQEGASFFLAEVRRLKSVVDLAHGPRPVLFLLDEILQGTNTRERSLGARGVIAHLLESGAFGLVSTHDLSLARLGDQFHDKIQYAHFTDQVEADRMTFDYKLKPGVVQTSNALRLMRAVGLKVDVPDDG